jgi:hypothetical protein
VRCPLAPEWKKAAPMKTATDRAADAIEEADIMFADEMGASLDLSRPQKWP